MGSPVELQEIRAFLALSEELHFARTADRLGITPSRVSQTISLLETRLGVRLFDRTSRRVALTIAGERLLERLAPAYEELQAALSAVTVAAGEVNGSLRVGSYNRAVGGPHLMRIMDRFSAEHPACAVTYVDTGARNYLEVLRTGGVDIVAARLPVNDPQFAVGPILSSEQVMILVGANHRLAGRPAVHHDDLAGETVTDLAAFPREMMDAFFPPVTASGKRIRRVESPSWEQILVQVAAGHLLHPTVAFFFDYFSHPGVVAIPVVDIPRSQTALVWSAGDNRRVIQEFVAVAQAVVES